MVSKPSKDKQAAAIDAELDKLDHEEAKIEAELAGLESEPIPSWNEVLESGIATIEKRELRKGLLPKLRRSLAVRRKELEIEKHERNIEAIVSRQDKLSDGLEELRNEARRMQEEADRRGGELQATVHQISTIRSAISRAQREIDELKGM